MFSFPEIVKGKQRTSEQITFPDKRPNKTTSIVWSPDDIDLSLPADTWRTTLIGQWLWRWRSTSSVSSSHTSMGTPTAWWMPILPAHSAPSAGTRHQHWGQRKSVKLSKQVRVAGVISLREGSSTGSGWLFFYLVSLSREELFLPGDRHEPLRSIKGSPSGRPAEPEPHGRCAWSMALLHHQGRPRQPRVALHCLHAVLGGTGSDGAAVRHLAAQPAAHRRGWGGSQRGALHLQTRGASQLDDAARIQGVSGPDLWTRWDFDGN